MPDSPGGQEIRHDNLHIPGLCQIASERLLDRAVSASGSAQQELFIRGIDNLFRVELAQNHEALVLESDRSNISPNAAVNCATKGPVTLRPKSHQPRVTPSPSYSGAILNPPTKAICSSQTSSLRWSRIPKRLRASGLNCRTFPPAASKGFQNAAGRLTEPTASMSTRTSAPRCRARMRASRNRSPKGPARKCKTPGR